MPPREARLLIVAVNRNNKVDRLQFTALPQPIKLDILAPSGNGRKYDGSSAPTLGSNNQRPGFGVGSGVVREQRDTGNARNQIAKKKSRRNKRRKITFGPMRYSTLYVTNSGTDRSLEAMTEKSLEVKSSFNGIQNINRLDHR
ncbi:hypothetical protein B0H13DRAFT_1888441 [Mycena leptocephala]|nr:hypothetical protein B0H13DRAFT_1888441 [Mycena leptocephala]